MSTLTEAACQTVLVVGKESAGKSTLISSLAGMPTGVANFRGSTVAVERYQTDNFVFVDTPGIFRQSDTETTRRALAALGKHETILLVAQATQLDEDLAELLPLVTGKRGVVVVSNWDRIQPGEAALEAIERLSHEADITFITVDGRCLNQHHIHEISEALLTPSEFNVSNLRFHAGWRIEPRPGILEHRVLGPILAAALLILPALATIFGANELANVLHPVVEGWLDPVVAHIHSTWPNSIRILLTNRTEGFGYGLLDMGPFLLVWALPTVVLFSVILGVYKSSGLVERINIALHPYVRHVGLSGRDIVRIMMGFGCNVPAVVSTRACSGCSRDTAIAAIAFGAACSYQLPATMAVLSSVSIQLGGSPIVLNLIYLSYLFLTTLVYLRLSSPRSGRDALNILMTPRRPFMQWPTLRSLWLESRMTIQQFFLQAMPIFVAICIIASLLAYTGVLDVMSRGISPMMAIFNLPADASLPVMLASIRKDGIFLFAGDQGFTTPMTAAQTLTAVYLAGVLFPCLVTVLTIAKETHWQRTAVLLFRQAAFALVFSLILAWGTWWIL